MGDREAFEPPRYLRNPHLQSILNSQGPRRLRARRILRGFDSQQLLLTADDGTRLTAALDRSARQRGALVGLLHGWEGCITSAYMVTTASRLLAAGFDVLRVNLRDHGDTHHLNHEIFHSCRIAEVVASLGDLATKRV